MRNIIKQINFGIIFKCFVFASLVFVFLLIVFGKTFLPGYLQENMYSISNLKRNINAIEVGDTLAYGINGHYSWQIIGIDKNSGMIEVVSKSDAANITLEGGYSADYYSEVLQSTADMYNDNKYVVSARSATMNDLSKFDYDSEFWLNDIDGNNIKTSTSLWSFDSDRNYKIYVYPNFQLRVDSSDDCYVTNKSFGDICDNHVVNGIDRFIWVDDGTYVQWGKIASYLIPEIPLEISVDSASTDVNAKAKRIIDSFPSFMSSSYNFFGASQSSDVDRKYDAIRAFFDSQDNDAIIYTGDGNNNNCSVSNDGRTISCNSFIRYSAESKTFAYSSGPIYVDNKKTKGFRPILTLNLNVDGENLNSDTNNGNNNNIVDGNSDINSTSGVNGANQDLKNNDFDSVVIDAVIPNRNGNHNQSEIDVSNDVKPNDYIPNSSHNNLLNNNSSNTDSNVEIIKESKVSGKSMTDKMIVYVGYFVFLLIIFLIILFIYTFINITKINFDNDVNKK